MSAVASALPLVAVRHPPFTDLPEHVASIATLARLLPGGGGAPYQVAFGSSQYFLYHFAGALLTRALGDPLLAHGILLASAALMWPLALRSLLRALGRDERLALFGCMLVYNRALVIGFLPFFASIPLLLFALATLVRQLDPEATHRRRRAVALGALSLALFYTHVSSSVLFALVAAVMIAARVPFAPRAGRAWLGASLVLPLVPTAVVAALWMRAESLTMGRSAAETSSPLPLGTAISAVPIWTFDIWRSHSDELCAGLWWTAFAVILAAGLRREVTASGAFAMTPFACAVVMYLVTPHYLGFAGYLDVRLAPVLVLFALLGLAPSPGRLGDVPLGVAGVAALLLAGNSAFEMRRVEREQVGDLDALLAHARPGTKLVMLNFEISSRRVPFWPYVFAGSYHRARGGLVAGYSFSELAHWPIHYAPGAAPPVHKPFWVYQPCAYRYREDGAYYDYVLVQGRAEPFADPTPGPSFVEVARSHALTLYEKTAAPSDDLSPDRGPCREPGPSEAPAAPPP